LFLDKTHGRSEETLEATNVMRTADGQRLEQRVKVLGEREYVLPGPMERDVYVEIAKLVHRAGAYRSTGRWVSAYTNC